jgi:hypothetical protein
MSTAFVDVEDAACLSSVETSRGVLANERGPSEGAKHETLSLQLPREIEQRAAPLSGNEGADQQDSSEALSRSASAAGQIAEVLSISRRTVIRDPRSALSKRTWGWLSPEVSLENAPNGGAWMGKEKHS